MSYFKIVKPANKLTQLYNIYIYIGNFNIEKYASEFWIALILKL